MAFRPAAAVWSISVDLPSLLCRHFFVKLEVRRSDSSHIRDKNLSPEYPTRCTLKSYSIGRKPTAQNDVGPPRNLERLNPELRASDSGTALVGLESSDFPCASVTEADLPSGVLPTPPTTVS